MQMSAIIASSNNKSNDRTVFNEPLTLAWAAGLGGYFAPEVILEGRKTRKVDVFSAGCLAFYILTLGGHPFELSG